MTNEETITRLNSMKDYYNDRKEPYYVGFDYVDNEAIDMAIKALEKLDHLTNRPCEACEYHKENGCSQWNCVFEEDKE